MKASCGSERLEGARSLYAERCGLTAADLRPRVSEQSGEVDWPASMLELD